MPDHPPPDQGEAVETIVTTETDVEIFTDPLVDWRTNWVPSPKWVVMLIAFVGSILMMLVESDGEWTNAVLIALISGSVGILSAYAAPNSRRL